MGKLKNKGVCGEQERVGNVFEKHTSRDSGEDNIKILIVQWVPYLVQYGYLKANNHIYIYLIIYYIHYFILCRIGGTCLLIIYAQYNNAHAEYNNNVIMMWGL